MRIKLVDFEDFNADPLAIYESDHIPTQGDMVSLPGDPGAFFVEVRVWQPPFDEVVVAVRSEPHRWWRRHRRLEGQR